jgi:hypothetical protein
MIWILSAPSASLRLVSLGKKCNFNVFLEEEQRSYEMLALSGAHVPTFWYTWKDTGNESTTNYLRRQPR